MKTLTLKNGVKMPMFGLGTDGVTHISKPIAEAIHLGYRLIDTASAYGNHQELGKAIKEINRAELFICTKINNGDLINATPAQAVNKILAELDTPYIDLLLIHSPSVHAFPAVINALITLKQQGKVKSIGVSNFMIKHLERLNSMIEHIDVNQMECHPYLFQTELIRYCQNNNITVMAYRPFGEGIFAQDKVLQQIAASYKTTLQQISLSWLMQMEMPVVARSNSAVRLAENLQALALSLSTADMEKIKRLNKNMRTCTGSWADFEEEKFVEELIL